MIVELHPRRLVWIPATLLLVALHECSFLTPSRSELGELRAQLAGARDVEDAWQRLAQLGRIPLAWLDDPSRRFVKDPGGSSRPARPTRDPAFAPRESRPSTVEHCALFAADVEGVLAAESAARRLVERLAPWGGPSCTTVAWWTLPRDTYDYVIQDTRPGVNYALPFAFNALYSSLPPGDDATPKSPFGHAGQCAHLWREQAARGIHFPKAVTPPGLGTSSGRFADFPNPFEALATIESAGYATLEYTLPSASAGVVFLIAPTVT